MKSNVGVVLNLVIALLPNFNQSSSTVLLPLHLPSMKVTNFSAKIAGSNSVILVCRKEELFHLIYTNKELYVKLETSYQVLFHGYR